MRDYTWVMSSTETNLKRRWEEKIAERILPMSVSLNAAPFEEMGLLSFQNGLTLYWPPR